MGIIFVDLYITHLVHKMGFIDRAHGFKNVGSSAPLQMETLRKMGIVTHRDTVNTARYVLIGASKSNSIDDEDREEDSTVTLHQ